jgi:hypothetical protein
VTPTGELSNLGSTKWAMSKFTSEHLTRAVFVYVCQSTACQVVNNLESHR